MEIPRISTSQALELLQAGTAAFVDVRDPGSFAAGHIPGAHHVNDHNLEAFLARADKRRPHVIYCYHGNSSIGGAGYFLEAGFAEVSSMDGGFSAWQHRYAGQPELIESGRP